MSKDSLVAQLNEKYDIVGTIDTSNWDCGFILQTWARAEKKLLELRRDEYLNDQRLIIVFDRGKFNNSMSFRNFVQKWQQIINTVDISNFFLIIAHNDIAAAEEIKQDCIQISTDPVPINFELYQSDIVFNDHTPSSPEESPTFCILPWIHLMVHPFDHVQPCCNSPEVLGNTKTQTLAQAWNSSNMKRIRQSMISGAYHPACSKCYENERHSEQSARNRVNKEFPQYFDLVDLTNSDGSLDTFDLKYIDIRYSNICNLRCRTCSHHASSRWYSDEKKLNPSYDKPIQIKAGRYETDIWEQIVPHIDSLESIYFAGGEPLLMDEHYWLLDELEKRKKFDVKIFYNTNFTVVNKTKRHLFDYWKNFKNITVGASLDASGSRAEYLRKDTRWQDIIDNRLLLKERVPHVKFRISSTLSIINSLHLPDFHREWIELDLVHPDDISINLVLDPDWYKIDIATASFKEKIKEKYQSHIRWLSQQGASQQTLTAFEKCIPFSTSNDNTELLGQFQKVTRDLDRIRNENILDFFPELNELF